MQAVPRGAAVLAALSLSFACVALDNTKLVLAVPTLTRELEAISPFAGVAVKWVVEANLVVYASLLLLGGALSERLGARRVLLAGLGTFVVGSILSASAGSTLALCAGRAAVGLGAALLVPASLAAIEHMFGARGRARAVSVWTGSFAAAAALGPVLGGVLLERWGWRALMLANVPFALLGLAGVVELVPRTLPRRGAPLDPLGTALGFVAIVSLLVGLLGGVGQAAAVLALGTAAVACSALVLWQRRAPHPMLDAALFRRPAFRRTLVVILLAYLAFSGSSFAVAQYLQGVRAHAPTVAGLMTLPLSVAMLAGTLLAPLGMRRLGAQRALDASLGLALVGALLVSAACYLQSDVALGAALVPLAAGAGGAFSNATQRVLGSAPPERAGSAAAVGETAFELGGVLGVALLGTRLGSLDTGGSGASLAAAGGALALALALFTSRRSVHRSEPVEARQPTSQARVFR